MAYYETECKRKDELISALKEELSLYQRSSREKDYKLVVTGGHWSHLQLCACSAVCVSVHGVSACIVGQTSLFILQIC